MRTLALFNLGADLAMTPMGEHVGADKIADKNLFIKSGIIGE